MGWGVGRGASNDLLFDWDGACKLGGWVGGGEGGGW